MLLPEVERTLADPQASADISHLLTALYPLQGSNDLLFRVRFLRHLPLSSIGILEGRSPKITPAPPGSVFGFWVIPRRKLDTVMPARVRQPIPRPTCSSRTTLSMRPAANSATAFPPPKERRSDAVNDARRRSLAT